MAFCNLMLAHKPEKWDDDDEPKKGQRLSGRTKKAAGGGGDEQILPHYPLVLLRLELGQKNKIAYPATDMMLHTKNSYLKSALSLLVTFHAFVFTLRLAPV